MNFTNLKGKLNLLLATTACLSLFAIINADGQQEPNDPGSQFSGHVEKLLAEMTETEYQGATEIDEESGSLKCDCSGLMSYVLRHHFPEAYVSTKGEEAPWRKRPMSVTYYETFIAAGENESGNSPWHRVREMMDVRPGDILSWRKAEIEEGVSSGHTLMIASLPEEERDNRIRVRVIDSTRKSHTNDTRPAGTLGVGAGDMWFTVDRDGEPIGFYVDEESGQSTSHKIAIGRIVKPGSLSDESSNRRAKSIFERNAKNRDTGDSGKADSGEPQSEDDDFIGLRISAATRLADKRAIEWRNIDEDGEITPVKIGLTEERLNFVIEKGKTVRTIRG